MGAVYFYHLTRDGAAETLRALLPRALGQGWQVEVRGTDPAEMARLDEALWLGPEEAFLAHGLSGGPHDAAQPVLLTTAPGGGRDCIMCVGGAEISAEEVAAAARVCILFDGMDGAAVDAARRQWKALTGAGCAAQYWSQESGRWEKKAEAGG